MGNDVKKIMEETTKEIVEAQTEHPKKKKKLGGFALYLLGSAVVTVGMAAVMPITSECCSASLHSALPNAAEKFSEDFLAGAPVPGSKLEMP